MKQNDFSMQSKLRNIEIDKKRKKVVYHKSNWCNFFQNARMFVMHIKMWDQETIGGKSNWRWKLIDVLGKNWYQSKNNCFDVRCFCFWENRWIRLFERPHQNLWRQRKKEKKHHSRINICIHCRENKKKFKLTEKQG